MKDELFKVNKPLLKEVMGLVEKAAEVGMWNQGDWITMDKSNDASLVYNGQEFCGTAGCFAGWAVLMDGWMPRLQVSVHDGVEYMDLLIQKDDVVRQFSATEFIAADLLGLDGEDADWLFDANNTMDDLRSIVEELCSDGDDT